MLIEMLFVDVNPDLSVYGADPGKHAEIGNDMGPLKGVDREVYIYIYIYSFEIISNIE